MKVLIADDEAINRKLVRAVLASEGYEVIEARDGAEASAVLSSIEGPLVGLIDWNMPGKTGIEVCREARLGPQKPLFLLLVTARNATEDIKEGLWSGANDYVTKPFEPAELLARVRIGEQMVQLQHTLAQRVLELEAALKQVEELAKQIPPSDRK